MEKQKLFVGNLSFETTEEEVKALFSKVGTVKELRLKQKKGTAFVEMATPEEAAAAVRQLDQSEFKGRPLRVNPEVSKKKAKAVTRDRFQENANKKKSKKK